MGDQTATHRLLLATLRSFDLELDGLISLLSSQDLRVELELESLLLQNLLELLPARRSAESRQCRTPMRHDSPDLRVHTRTDRSEVLHHRDFRSQSRPYRSQLQSNDPTTNNHHLPNRPHQHSPRSSTTA